MISGLPTANGGRAVWQSPIMTLKSAALAAIDRDVGAVHQARFGRTQEGHHGGHLLRRAQAAQRIFLVDHALKTLGIALLLILEAGARDVDAARRHRIE